MTPVLYSVTREMMKNRATSLTWLRGIRSSLCRDSMSKLRQVLKAEVVSCCEDVGTAGDNLRCFWGVAHHQSSVHESTDSKPRATRTRTPGNAERMNVTIRGVRDRPHVRVSSVYCLSAVPAAYHHADSQLIVCWLRPLHWFE